MTKISTYVVDEKITALDKWIGSDANMQNRTKNFTPKKLAEYFNENQVINIGVPLQYKYYTVDPLEERPNGTLTFETEIGPTVNFSAVTTFLLSKYTTKQNIVSDFLNFLDGCKVLLFKASDINSFGFYRISNIESYEPDPNFFVVTVDYETGNGFMQEDNDYMLSLVSLPGGAIPTKTSELINDGDDGINPFISEVDINRTEWDAAYDGKINSAEVTGTSTKTLTLTKQDGSTIEASWTDDNTDAVTSVFGRTGDVTAQSGDYNTGQITEVTNKKYQTDNQALFNDATSSIQTQLDSKQPSLGYTPVPNTRTITINGTSYDLSANRSWTIDTNSAVWGNISGMLSNQTDLQGALNSKVPYSGATGNINLGEYGLTSGYYKFDLTPTGTPTSLGTMYWDSFYRTVSLIDGDGDTTLQIGQEERVLVHNNTGSTLTDGQVVYVTGSTGELPSVSLASNTSEATSSVTFGVVTETILNGADGFITTSGIIHGLNTLSYDEGSAIWLGSTPGTFTQTKPVAPLNSVLVGYVIKKSGGNGSIFVKIQNGYELEELHDVLISNVSGNEILAYEGSPTNLWKNKSVIDVLGFTPYNSTNPSNYISLTALSSTATGLSYNNTNGVFSLTSGYVIPTTTEESNWNTAYSNRITSASLPLSISSNSISISQATSTTNGYLTSSDWNTFNNKQVAGNYITALTGEATASGPGSSSITLSNSAVTGKLLTGVNITGGTVVDTDSILTAFGKLQNQINGLIGGSIYQGTWNAFTNTPSLSSGVGTKGYYYIVNVAGSTNLDGITDWNVGDWAIYDGTAWQQVDNTDAVVSVNGFTGAVSLTTSNISEGVNLYYTESRVSSNADVAANTAARHNAVTIGTANGLSLSTQVLSLGLASSSTNGALSSTDWNTFNNKQSALSGTGFVKITGSTISYDNSTYVPTSRTLTINGTAYDLSANRSWSVGTVTSVLGTGSYGGLTLTGSVTGSGSLTLGGTPTGTWPISVTGNAATATNADYANSSGTSLTTSAVSGTTNYVPKFTSGNTIGNSIIYDNGTNVGIGTTNPSEKLTVLDGKLFLTTSDPTIGGKIYGYNDTSVNLYSGGLKFQTRYFDGSNYVYADRLTINSSGNVGIGTTSPNLKLSVLGANGAPASSGTTQNGVLRLSGGTGIYNVLDFGINETNDYSWIQSTRANNLAVYDKLALQPLGGNVGIGTTSPSEKLQVGGSSGGVSTPTAIRLDDTYRTGGDSFNNLKFYLYKSATETYGFGLGDLGDVQYWAGTTSTGTHRFFTSQTERMRITSGGNVGIGTTSPAAKLHISGNANSAFLYSDGAGSGYSFADIRNTGARLAFGVENSTGSTSFTGALAYSSWIGSLQSSTAFQIVAGNSLSTTFLANGKVGIGTTSPVYKFHVNDTSDGIVGHFSGGVSNYTLISFKSNEANVYSTSLGSYNSGMLFRTGATDRMYITSSGQVQISSPISDALKLTNTNSGAYNGVLIQNDASNQVVLGIGGSTVGGSNQNRGYSGTVSNIDYYLMTNNTERMRITSSGNVGIGTTSPAKKLHVKGGNDNVLFLDNGGEQYTTQYFANNGTTKSFLVWDNTSSLFEIGTAVSADLRLLTNNAERMRITSSGNVGIGTTSPTSTLNLQNATNPQIDFHTGASKRADIRATSSSLFLNSITGNDIQLQTDGSTKVLITSGGNVGIGTTSPSYKLSVLSANSVTWLEDTSGASGAVFALFSAPGNTGMGSISRSGSSGSVSYNTTSDYRLKEDLKKINGVDLISKINVYDYKWKSCNERSYGVMAHELQEVIPSAVTGEKDGEQMQSVDYSKLVPLLIASIQELKAEIEILKNK